MMDPDEFQLGLAVWRSLREARDRGELDDNQILFYSPYVPLVTSSAIMSDRSSSPLLSTEVALKQEMAAFGASDAACYLYPGEEQQTERAAFCAGAAHAVQAPGAASEKSEDDLVYRLRKRSVIRQQITSRKSVQEGKPDRISMLLDEAADEIERLRRIERTQG